MHSDQEPKPDTGWGLRFVKSLVLAYPRRSAIASLCLLLAGLAEGISVASLLPLLGLVTGQGSNSGTDLGRYIQSMLFAVGLEPTLPTLLVLIVVMVAAKAVLVLVAMKQAGYTVAHVETELRLSLIRALMRARWEHFVTQRDGSLANAITIEAERAAIGYWRVCRMVAFGIQVAVYAAISFLVSWQITVAALVASFIGVRLLGRFVEISRRAGIRQTELLKSISERLVEGLSSIKPIKAMACENMLRLLLESDARDMNQARQQEVFSYESRYALYEPILAVLLAVGLYCALVVWNAELETVILLALLFWRALTRVNGIQTEYQDLARVESAFWSLKTAINQAAAESEMTTDGEKPLLRRSITFQDVSFSYKERRVLNNISLTLSSGSFTALTGPSGAGKTTIADLMVGLLRPQAGEVYVDDLAMSNMDMRAWRSMIGYVPQDTILFHDTVYENVVLANPALTQADAESALRAAGAWDFVSSLPQGLHSTVGERGAKLSGGQRQRISIARALVRRPKLLILDEVTSALDPDTEAAICSTLRQLKGRMTIFAISHQQALVEGADKVYFLGHKGRLLEQSGDEVQKRALAIEFS